jgi:hypothetical protein
MKQGQVMEGHSVGRVFFLDGKYGEIPGVGSAENRGRVIGHPQASGIRRAFYPMIALCKANTWKEYTPEYSINYGSHWPLI